MEIYKTLNTLLLFSILIGVVLSILLGINTEEAIVLIVGFIVWMIHRVNEP